MSTQTLRFYVAELTELAGGSFKVVLQPSYSHGANADWSKYTPSGRIELSLTAEVAIEFYRDALHAKQTLAIEMSPTEDVPSNLGGPA